MDYTGSTDWWKKFYSGLSPVSATPGNTPLILQNNSVPYQTSVRTFKCAYNANAPSTCRLDGQTISSNTVTETHTNSFSFQGKVGAAYKQKSTVNEVSVEWTFDFGYSFSNSEATSKVVGETTVASVQVRPGIEGLGS